MKIREVWERTVENRRNRTTMSKELPRRSLGKDKWNTQLLRQGRPWHAGDWKRTACLETVKEERDRSAGEVDRDLPVHKALLRTLDLFLRTIGCWWKDSGEKKTLPSARFIYMVPRGSASQSIKRERRQQGVLPWVLSTLGFTLDTTDQQLVGASYSRVGCRWLSVAGGRVKTQSKKQVDLLRIEMSS